MKYTLEDTLRINQLLEFYGNLLTDSQKEVMSSYFVYNLSLAEIADEKEISRTAVSDSLNKSIKKLESFESQLNLLKVFEKERKEHPESIDIISRIEENLKNGI